MSLTDAILYSNIVMVLLLGGQQVKGKFNNNQTVTLFFHNEFQYK